MKKLTKTAVVACMKDEGPFVLEWVAYHKAIGFDKIVIITNDCTDLTDKIVKRLQALGVAIHLINNVDLSDKPQISGIRTVYASKVLDGVDWVLHIDADEFLNIDQSIGTVRDLLEVASDADAMAIQWKLFGHNNIGYWNGGWVLEKFTRCEDSPNLNHIWHKTFFRPEMFTYGIDHMPKAPLTRDVRLINTRGQKLNNTPLLRPGWSHFRMKTSEITWENACINHYAIRSQDSFLMKNKRGDGMKIETQRGLNGNKYYLKSAFYELCNRNEVEDESILKNDALVKSILDEMLQDSEISRLHRRSIRRFRKKRDRILTPEQVLKWSAQV